MSAPASNDASTTGAVRRSLAITPPADTTAASLTSVAASSNSSRASPIALKRRLASFSRHRRSSRRTDVGTSAGSAVKSGARSRIAAM